VEAIAIDGRLGGARSRMEAAGVTLDLECTLYYQGVVSGTGSQTFEFANRLYGFVKLDTGALGKPFSRSIRAWNFHPTARTPWWRPPSVSPSDSAIESPFERCPASNPEHQVDNNGKGDES